MSKFLKFIVNLFLICAILAAAAILVPPIVGVQTTIIDSASMDTNLPLGSITYSTDVTVDEMKNGDEVLKDSSSSTYAYIIKGKTDEAGKYRVVSATDKNGAEETVSFEGSVPRVRVIVPYLGYIIIAMHSTEGLIIIGLVVALVIILFILSELWKKEPVEEEEEESNNTQKAENSSADEKTGKADKKAAKKAEKARAKQAKKDKKHSKSDSSAQPAADTTAEPEPILPRPDVKVDVNPEIPDLPDISLDSRDDDGGTSDDELNNFLLNEEKEEESSNKKEELNTTADLNVSEPEEQPEKKEPTAEPETAAKTEDDGIKPLEQEVVVNESVIDEPPVDDDALTADDSEPENKKSVKSDKPVNKEPAVPAQEEKKADKEPVTSASTGKGKASAEPDKDVKPAAPKNSSTAATQKIELPDEFDLSEAIETATKEAEAKAEEARSKTTPIHLPKEAFSLDNLKEDEPEPVDDSKREFTPVEHATLDELLEQAKKDGEEPEVRKDDATGITFVDYSDEL